jgi:hypothetical protein
MNNKFDELTKSMAQSVTRRAALKKFGVGLAGMALTCFGLANKTEAGNNCLPKGTSCNAFQGHGNGCLKCCNSYGCSLTFGGGYVCVCH